MTEESIDFNRFKFCECGCKELIPILDKQQRPRKFMKGHENRGKNNPNWNDKKLPDQRYDVVYKPDHPFAQSNGCVRKHRLMYEEFYKCCLLPKSEIHHINGDTHDNRIENFMVFKNHSEHIRFENKKDMSDRFCSKCGSTNTHVDKFGHVRWYRDKNGGFICSKCYHKNRKRITKRILRN